MITAGQSSSTSLVTIIILSYARPDHLRRALQSAVGQTYPLLEIIVVDNPSGESSVIAQIVQGEFPSVHLLSPNENCGYAGGMNYGIQHASGAYIHLSEDDIILEPDCIQSLVDCSLRETGDAIYTGLLYTAESQLINYAGGDIDLTATFSMQVYGRGGLDSEALHHPRDVSYIPGSMMFAQSSTWRNLGGFLEDFFVYFEDTEICLRARRFGYGLRYRPLARAAHIEARSSEVSDSVAVHKLKNFIYLYLLHAKATVLPEFFMRHVVAAYIRSLTGNRKMLALYMKAHLWVASHLPDILRARWTQVART